MFMLILIALFWLMALNLADTSEEVNGVDSTNGENLFHPETITLKAQEYLNSEDVRNCTDPKLRKEKEQLEGLLESYRKLIGKLDKKFENNEERERERERLKKIPEIYALLHPELYKSCYEEEKDRLIQKFSQRRHFSPVDKIIPPICHVPPASVRDKRQEEKERLIRILASSPAQFFSSEETPKKTPSRRLRRPKFIPMSDYPQNDREVEKERLSKILAMSGPISRRETGLKSANQTCKISEKVTIAVSTEQHPEALPLQADKTDSESLHDRGSPPKRRSSIATQTDPSDFIEISPKVLPFQPVDDKKPIENINETSNAMFSLSPREKLLSDLHGGFYIVPGAKAAPRNVISDNKMRQIAYARALEEQIEEKRRLKEEEKQREREEEELIERRLRAQQERLNHQLSDEQKKRFEWMAQRQSQEEVLRRKMVEMELEAQEVKRTERRKRMERTDGEEERKEKRVLDRSLLPPHSTHSEPALSIRRPPLTRALQRSVPPRLNLNLYKTTRERERENAMRQQGIPFEGLRAAPLLEADRQNILATSGYALHSNPLRLGRGLEENGKGQGNFKNMRPSNEKRPAGIYPPAASVKPPKAARTKDVPEINESMLIRGREKVEEMLKARLDAPIDGPAALLGRSSPPPRPAQVTSPSRPLRPPSPVIPAVKTRGVINTNTKLLDNKWQVPEGGSELDRTLKVSGPDNILTQLGAFRRQLHQEHVKLEARLLKQQSP